MNIVARRLLVGLSAGLLASPWLVVAAPGTLGIGAVIGFAVAVGVTFAAVVPTHRSIVELAMPTAAAGLPLWGLVTVVACRQAGGELPVGSVDAMCVVLPRWLSWVVFLITVAVLTGVGNRVLATDRDVGEHAAAPRPERPAPPQPRSFAQPRRRRRVPRSARIHRCTATPRQRHRISPGTLTAGSSISRPLLSSDQHTQMSLRTHFASLPQLADRFATPAAQLLTRLAFGPAFAMTGWGKLNNLDGTIQFFTELGIPLPGLQAPMVATIELVGGLLLLVGFATRPAALMLTGTMLVALLTAHLTDIAKALRWEAALDAAAPIPFLIATLWLLAKGAGAVSVDHLLHRARAGSRPVGHSPAPGPFVPTV